jgi:hypothetical protein
MLAAARRAALLLWAASTASTSWAAVPTTAGAHTAAASSTPDSRATVTACQLGGEEIRETLALGVGVGRAALASLAAQDRQPLHRAHHQRRCGLHPAISPTLRLCSDIPGWSSA